MIDPLGIHSLSYNKEEDLVILDHPNILIFQKEYGEIRIVEVEPESRSITNRSPMFLEEVLIRELMEYKNAAMERNE